MDNFLGTEFNILGEIETLKDLTFFALAGFFVPGFHFRQMKGVPLNDAQAAYIKERRGPRVPLLGDEALTFLILGSSIHFNGLA